MEKPKMKKLNRPKQCFVMVENNPPISVNGLWIASYFAPWLDEPNDKKL